MMQKIRRFVQGRDEDAWVSVFNKVFREFDDFRSITVEDMLMSETSPTFDAAGMFIAELEGEPVGIVNAYVDKMRKEKKGFIRMLGVVPEYRRRGIGRALAEKAMESLRERGMETVEAGAVMDKPEAIQLWESMGFHDVRIFSLMKRNLENIPSGIGESREVQLRKFQKGSQEDLKLITWLSNETFSEHYNYRPDSVEETRYFLEQDPIFKDQEWILTLLQNKPVGYVGVGIDQKYNEEKNTRCGWILSIGVLKPSRLKGIGTRLMIEGMKLLKTKGMTEAMLGVDDQNPTKAIKLYEKVGFQAARKDIAYIKAINENV
jgi:ribosomal protein S18 acetylase RimI-like enzyme